MKNFIRCFKIAKEKRGVLVWCRYVKSFIWDYDNHNHMLCDELIKDFSK